MKNNNSNQQDLNLNHLINQSGVTTTEVRPLGKVLINNTIIPCKSSGSYIPKNANVKVIQLENGEPIIECN